jgi:transposase
MAARLSRKRLPRYSLEFKLGAVKLSEIPGVEVRVVAEALDIHPVMLSRWRQESREGRLKGFAAKPQVVTVRKVVKLPPIREIKRLQELERAHRLLKEEHALLKKAIRFCSERRQTSLPSWKRSGPRFR